MRYLIAVTRVLINIIRFRLLQIIHFGRISVTFVQLMSISTVIDFRGKGARLTIKGRVSSRSGVTFAIRNGNLTIGKKVFLNKGCTITCHSDISIGDNCLFGPNVLMYDHDHTFGLKKIVNQEGYNTKPIIIGDNVLVGANCVILKGSVIGDNCVIATGTIVKGKIPANSIVSMDHQLVIKEIK